MLKKTILLFGFFGFFLILNFILVNKIRNRNPIIGSFKNAKFSSETLPFSKGDAILLYSDGIVEGMNPSGEQLGLELLMDLFLDVAKENVSASVIISNFLMKLEEFYEGTLQKDDRTLIVIKL